MKKGVSLSPHARSGLRALHILMVDIIKKPAQFCGDADLLSALKSQGGVAKLRRSIVGDSGEILETYPMSLNSLKTYADEYVSGGFKSLNDLRLKAIDSLHIAIKREEQANKRTRSGLTLKVAQLEHELELLRQTNMIMTRALSESLNQFVNIRDASSDVLRRKFSQDATETLRAILTMAMPPFNILEEHRAAPAPSADITLLSDYRKG